MPIVHSLKDIDQSVRYKIKREERIEKKLDKIIELLNKLNDKPDVPIPNGPIGKDQK